jgi:hypothetical protein
MISPSLSHRIAKAFNVPAGLILPIKQRDRIIKEVERAEIWEKLPEDIKQIIEEIEKNPDAFWPIDFSLQQRAE